MAGQTQRHRGLRASRWRLAIWSAAALLLLLPLVAMQFTDEVVWDVTDFVVFGAMLVGALGAWELAAWRSANGLYRAAVGIAVAAAFLLVWVNLAVGIIGSEDDPANAMFGGVLAVGLIGTLSARFRARGMAWAMGATGLAQAFVALMAPPLPFDDQVRLIALTALLAALWLGAALLFRMASRRAGHMGSGG